MTKVYLVTSYDPNIDWGDSLFVDGVFSSYENAQEHVDLLTIEDDSLAYDITDMSIDNPEYETDKYPSALCVE